MNKLAPPISVAKVAASLGVVSGDVGTLCTSNKINKASLHKPTWVGLDPTKACDESLKPMDKKPTGNYEAVGFGLFVPYCTNISDIITTASKPWVHAAPTTANDNYKCLAHFNGYDHSAKLTSVSGGLNVTEDADIRCSPTPTSNDTAVGFENIPFFAKSNNHYYYGCLLDVRGRSRNESKCVISTEPIGTTVLNPMFLSGITARQGDEVKIVVFATNTAGKTSIIGGGQAVDGAKYYSCAFAEGVVTSKTKTLPYYGLQASVARLSNGIYILSVHNYHPSRKIQEFSVVVKEVDEHGQFDNNPNTTTGRLATLTFEGGIPAGGTKEIEFSTFALNSIRVCSHDVFYENSTNAIRVDWIQYNGGDADLAW